MGAAAGRPYYCSNVAGETTVNKPILNVGETLTVSSKSNTPVNGFFYAVYNADNNPTGNSPTVVCTGTGTNAQCPNGGTPMILSDPNNKTDGTGLRTSGSASVTYANLFVTDKTTGKQVTNIQINAYFSLNGGQWSYPEAKCVTFTKMGAACVPTWTPDPALTCTGTDVTQTSNCGGTRVVPGTKSCAEVGVCTEVALYAKTATGYSTTPMTVAQRNALHIGDKIRIAITGSKANLKARFRVFIDDAVETPEWKMGQAYSAANHLTMYFSDYEITKAGNYKFEGQVSSK